MTIQELNEMNKGEKNHGVRWDNPLNKRVGTLTPGVNEVHVTQELHDLLIYSESVNDDLFQQFCSQNETS